MRNGSKRRSLFPTLVIAAVSLSALTRFDFCHSRAVPYVAEVRPESGPEEGGYIVTVAGRNLGFLDIDCDIMFGDKMGVKPTVTDAWDKIEVIAPRCGTCGKVEVYASCNGLKSNKRDFTFENECYGPLAVDGYLTKIPELFSGRENCTICMDLVHLTMASAPDKASYQSLQFAMQDACYSNHFKKWTFPGTKCTRNYKDACKTVMGTMGDDLIDTMWQLWDTQDGYWNGWLPNKVCQKLFKCDFSKDWTKGG
eukprot:g11368.t1